MGLPGKRLSRSSKRRRASHFALKSKTLLACTQCKKPILPHRVCPYCGSFKGKNIIPMKVKGAKGTAEVAKQPEKKQSATKESAKASKTS